MKTMNVNGQNGVATSAAIKNAVVKAVKMIDKAENGKTGYVMIGEGLRLSFNGARFIKGAKDNFIFNGKIESKGGNGRYNEVINVNYKNLDNEEGLCLNDMINGVLDAILNYIDNTIVKYEGDDNFSLCAETLQNFRNDYFGSRLIVDNIEDFKGPDTFIGFDANEVVSKLCNEMVNSETPYAFIKLDKYYLGCYLDLKEDEVGYKLIIPEWDEIKDFDMDNDDDVQELQEFYEWVDLWIDEGISLFVEKYCLNLKVEDYSPITEEEAINMTYQKGYLNSPDTFEGFGNISKECDGNMMACVDKYGQEFIDRVIKEYADVVEEAVSAYGFYGFENTIKHCVKDALKDMRYNPDRKRLAGCSVVPDVVDWFVGNNFCNYFEDVYGFDWDSCQEFYKEYCDKMKSFADEYDERMVGALKDFDKESVYDKMAYDINWDGEYIEVSIEMDDFVAFIKKNMVTKDSKLHLFNDENLGFVLYDKLDPDYDNIKQFYEDLKNMVPMVTDVAFYKDGLYIYMTDMTIREYYELHKNEDGDVEEIINYHIDKFMSPDDVEVFNNFVTKTDDDGIFYISEDADGDLYVSGNEDFCRTYFDDDTPMTKVYVTLMHKMNEEILKIENKIEKEIEESKYKVLDAFECESDFNVEYDEWWDYILGKTPNWIIDKYYDKFCDVLYGYFVEYAKDYGYVVEKIDGGISLEKSNYKKKTIEEIKEEAKNIIAIFDSECSTTIEYQECWDRMQDLVREIAKL